MKLTNTNRIIDVMLNDETCFYHDCKCKIVAHNNNNKMCAIVFSLVIILSQCLFNENVHIRLSFAS